MIGEDFMFGKTSLSDFDMMMCAPEDVQKFVTRNFDKSEITSLRANPNHYTTVYTDVLTLNFFIMKDDNCGQQENLKLTGDEVHYICAWLESPKRPTELIVRTYDDEMTVHYYGTFTSVQPFVFNEDCLGLNLVFTCNAPYGYSDEYIIYYNMNGRNNPLTGLFMNMSAEYDEYLMPKIEINSLSTFDDETLSIKNESDSDNTMTFTLPSGVSKIIIDCKKKIITDENGDLVPMSSIGLTLPSTDNYNFIAAETFVFYWLSLVPNENILTFTPSSGNSIKDIRISARYAIKAGGF